DDDDGQQASSPVSAARSRSCGLRYMAERRCFRDDVDLRGNRVPRLYPLHVRGRPRLDRPFGEREYQRDGPADDPWVVAQIAAPVAVLRTQSFKGVKWQPASANSFARTVHWYCLEPLTVLAPGSSSGLDLKVCSSAGSRRLVRNMRYRMSA